MTPLQTSSDPEVADWEKPLGAACFTRPWSGGVPGADWERACFTRPWSGVFHAPTGIGVLPGADSPKRQ